MMTPEDARRLVKNRNERKGRRQDALEKEEIERLDYIEEVIAIYLADSDFVEYVTETIDACFPAAVDSERRFLVGFSTWLGNCQDYQGLASVKREGNYRRDYYYSAAYVCSFATHNCGIELTAKELAPVFAETIAALYEDAGWAVGEIEEYFALADDDDDHRISIGAPMLFEIFYE